MDVRIDEAVTARAMRHYHLVRWCEFRHNSFPNCEFRVPVRKFALNSTTTLEFTRPRIRTVCSSNVERLMTQLRHLSAFWGMEVQESWLQMAGNDDQGPFSAFLDRVSSVVWSIQACLMLDKWKYKALNEANNLTKESDKRANYSQNWHTGLLAGWPSGARVRSLIYIVTFQRD